MCTREVHTVHKHLRGARASFGILMTRAGQVRKLVRNCGIADLIRNC